MIDDKLEKEEAERIASYESIKSNVKGEVGGEIVAEAQTPTPSEAAKVEDLAGEMRNKAVREVGETEREVERGRVVARISQVVDYLFFIVYSLLGIRLFLELVAARSANTFVQFINSISDPFYAPFRGIARSPSTPEGFTLAIPIIIALVVYLILHIAVNRLLRIFVHRKTEI